MARIRTVKPEFFQHERLHEAEVESGLPLRLAFVGLWTQCDREGRFEWRPARLKLNILPWDDVDFSRVLDALVTRGFVVQYTVDGQEIGAIPSWRKHQVINNRESASELPEQPKNKKLRTRAARVQDASCTRHGNCKGEGKGKEGNGTSRDHGDFDRWYASYPRREARPRAEQAWQKLTDADRKAALDALDSWPFPADKKFTPLPASWLNARRWEDEHQEADAWMPS
jgi:hypothetical protein